MAGGRGVSLMSFAFRITLPFALLTISAFAERAMLHLAKDIGRSFDIAPKTDAPERAYHLFVRTADPAKEVPVPASA